MAPSSFFRRRRARRALLLRIRFAFRSAWTPVNCSSCGQRTFHPGLCFHTQDLFLVPGSSRICRMILQCSHPTHAQIAVLRQAESSKFCNRLRVTGLQAVLQVAGGLTRGSPAECDEFVPLPGAYPNIWCKNPVVVQMLFFRNDSTEPPRYRWYIATLLINTSLLVWKHPKGDHGNHFLWLVIFFEPPAQRGCAAGVPQSQPACCQKWLQCVELSINIINWVEFRLQQHKYMHEAGRKYHQEHLHGHG